MSAWSDVDEWKSRHTHTVIELSYQLCMLGWTLVETDDGQWGARPLKIGTDPVECFFREGEPEARGETPEILLATVRALPPPYWIRRKDVGAAS